MNGEAGEFFSPETLALLEQQLATVAPTIQSIDWTIPQWDAGCSVDVRTPVRFLPDTNNAKIYAQLDKLALYVAEKMFAVFPAETITNPYGQPPAADAAEAVAKYIHRCVFNVSFQTFDSWGWREGISKLLDRTIFSWNASEDLEPSGLYVGGTASGPFASKGFELPFPIQYAESEFHTGGYAGSIEFRWIRLPPPYAAFFLAQNAMADLSLAPVKYSSVHGFIFEKNWFIQHVAPWGAQDKNTLPAKLYEQIHSFELIRSEFNQQQARKAAISFVIAVIALLSFGSAAAAISASGLTLSTAASLITAVDSFPGVDLYNAGRGLRLLNVIVNPESFLSAAAMEAPADAAIEEGAAMEFTDFGDVEIDDFGIGNLDFPVYDFGELDPNIFSLDTAGALDILPVDDSIDSLISGSTGILGNFNIGSFITGLTSTFVQYDLGRRRIEQTGQIPPATTRPVAGAVRRLPDGSTARTNVDGSVTVTKPNGQQQTVTSTGQIVAGPSASFIPGVSNTILIAGAVGLGALFLLRKRG